MRFSTRRCRLRHAPDPVTILSTVGADATVAGTVPLEIQSPDHAVDRVDFAVDGTEVGTALDEPYQLELDTATLADGPHQLAVNVAFDGGGYAIAVWQITVSNAPGADRDRAGRARLRCRSPSPRSRRRPRSPAQPAATRSALYRAVFPARPVSVKQLDAALVGYLGLGGAAREIQGTLQRAGLQPPPNTGTEAVARMLDLRLNHPAAEDDLELLPYQAATRAEAAFSFAQLLHLDDWSRERGPAGGRRVHAAGAHALAAAGPHHRGALRRLSVRLGRHEPDRRDALRRPLRRRLRLLRASSGASTSSRRTPASAGSRACCAAGRPTR